MTSYPGDLLTRFDYMHTQGNYKLKVFGIWLYIIYSDKNNKTLWQIILSIGFDLWKNK